MRRATWAAALAVAAFAGRAQGQQGQTSDPASPQTAADAAREQGTAVGQTAADAAREAGGAAGQAAAAPAAAAQAGANQANAAVPLADRCVAFMRGQLDPAQRAEVAPRCEELVRAGASHPTGGAAAGTSTATPQAGETVRTEFTTAAGEIGNKHAALGATARGDVRNTLVTNPIGWFSGLGMNVEYSRPLGGFDKLSWVADARYARAKATNGEVSSLGIGGGADFFIYGRNNEGLRIGPRMELAFGSENVQGSTTFARLGLSGEVGYNFIASNGLSAGIAGGIGGRLAGDAQNEDFDSFTGGELGPYLKLGFGYSW